MSCLTAAVRTCRQSIPEFCADQLILVDLVSSIRVIPIDNLVQTVRSVVRQPPNIGLNVSRQSWRPGARVSLQTGEGGQPRREAC